MMLDAVIVGAPGSGLFGALFFALVAVFVARLMVGARFSAIDDGRGGVGRQPGKTQEG